MSRFCTLCSSSSGNSTYIGCSAGGILIDAGTNAKRLTAALSSINVMPETIMGIFLTHEHADHVGALRVFASRYKIPVYGTEGTLKVLEKAKIINGCFEVFPMTEKGAEIGGMEVKCFKTSHDSAQSCGYTVSMPDERKISIVTDTGVVTRETADAVKGSDLILLESNHDREMLMEGSYPYYLKKRIASVKGHLSNDDCAEAAGYFVDKGATRIILGHLSRENNTAAKAYKTTKDRLGEMGAVEGTDYILQVAPPGLGEKMVIF